MKWKNLLIKGLLWAFNPETTRPRHGATDHRILVVSTTGLGDTLWGTPAIRALRQSYPDGEISVLTSGIGAQVLEHNKHIDTLYTLGNSVFFSLLQLFFRMRKENYDTILVFHTSQRLILPFCALLEPSRIIGSEGINKDLDFLLTDKLPKLYQHEIARRLELAKCAGAHIHDYRLEVMIRKEDKSAVDRLLNQHGIADHEPIIGIHPGAMNTFKQWPKEHFIELGNRLVNHLGGVVFVTGNKSEALLLLEIASQIPGAIPLAGELDVTAFTALLKRMTIFVCNDTGPMHLSFAAQTKTVAFFGPTDPNLCGPFHVGHVEVLQAQRTCAPCLKKKCTDPFCLRQIGVDAAYDAAVRLVFAHEEMSCKRSL